MFIFVLFHSLNNFLFSLQLSELEQRVIEAEERAEEAEDKVSHESKIVKLCNRLFNFEPKDW